MKLEALVNLECLYMSHNLLKNIDGIVSLTTLIELNMSFNLLNDLTGIDELNLL